MEIPQNDRISTLDSKITEIVNSLNSKGWYSAYSRENGINLQDATKLCEMFVAKGYHAKIVFFCDHRAAYQCFIIQKDRVEDTNGRLVYDRIIG